MNKYNYLNSQKDYDYLRYEIIKNLKSTVDGLILLDIDEEEIVGEVFHFIAKYMIKKQKTVISKDTLKNCVMGAKRVIIVRYNGRGIIKMNEKGHIDKVILNKVDIDMYEKGEVEIEDDSYNEVYNKVNFDLIIEYLNCYFKEEEMTIFKLKYEQGLKDYEIRQQINIHLYKLRDINDKIINFIKQNIDVLLPDARLNTTYNVELQNNIDIEFINRIDYININIDEEEED